MLSSNNAGLWFRLIIMLLSAVLALFIGQSFIAQSEQKRLVSYAQEVLAQGVAVAQESRDTVQRILLLGNIPCSDTDLRELRLLSFYALNLRDVGRIENDRLICSAGWGRLTPPIALPPPDLTTSTGTQLWTAMERLVDPRITADIASQGGVATITSSAAFRRYSQPPQGYSATLINKNLDHPYQTFGSLTLPRKEDLWRGDALFHAPGIATDKGDIRVDTAQQAATMLANARLAAVINAATDNGHFYLFEFRQEQRNLQIYRDGAQRQVSQITRQLKRCGTGIQNHGIPRLHQ